MSPPLNNPIPITHAGGGIVTFPVPFLSPTSSKQLNLQPHTLENAQGDRMAETPLCFELLKIGGNLQNILKKNGSFYVQLLQEGFLQNGAITLIGLMPSVHLPVSGVHVESKRIFKAVIQLDGDIICQIDRSILKEKRASELIEGYTAVQDQFLEGFNKVLHGMRLVIITSLSLLIPALYIIWKLLESPS